MQVLNYVKNLLILVSTVTGYVSISTFASLVCVPAGITSFYSRHKLFCNHCKN